jgi:UDP-N-acetylmuramate--alanine ligase
LQRQRFDVVISDLRMPGMSGMEFLAKVRRAYPLVAFLVTTGVDDLDVGVEAIRTALDQFRGVDRRFQLRGRAAGVSVIDDYGHHPTEIKATLAAARQCGFDKIHVIFQPHRYTRTRDLMDEFSTAFADADSLFVLDIYAASEKPIEGITGEILAQRIREKGGKHAQYASSFADAVNAAATAAHDGDMILTLGAGSVSQFGPMILDKLAQR